MYVPRFHATVPQLSGEKRERMKRLEIFPQFMGVSSTRPSVQLNKTPQTVVDLYHSLLLLPIRESCDCNILATHKLDQSRCEHQAVNQKSLPADFVRRRKFSGSLYRWLKQTTEVYANHGNDNEIKRNSSSLVDGFSELINTYTVRLIGTLIFSVLLVEFRT